MFFFINHAATTQIYTLSLHDALPIYIASARTETYPEPGALPVVAPAESLEDRKSTRLNSSHPSISYAVFCLKKKNTAAHRGDSRACARRSDAQPHSGTV